MTQKVKRNLDFTRFFPEIYAAVAGDDYTVYAYMNDGAVHMLDMKPLIKEGGVFEVLKDEEFFRKKLTVIGYTVAWDVSGDRDPEKCLDIDPFMVFECPEVDVFPGCAEDEEV